MNNNYEMQQALAKVVVKEFCGKFGDGINQRIDSIKFEPNYTGSSNFDYLKNTIYINCQYADDVNHYVHELFHAISTKYLSDKVLIGYKNEIYSPIGNDLFFENCYGYAINEGATHSYTRDATNNRFGSINPVESYDFCANIYKNLENAVGKNNLKVIYLNADCREFISTIAKACHTKEQYVTKLITNMDAYFDTFKIYNSFLENPNAMDVNYLLKNCYIYLGQILKDYNTFYNKNFDIEKDLSKQNLSPLSVAKLEKLINNIDLTINNVGEFSIKQFEKMSKYFYQQSMENSLKDFKIMPKMLKNSEFFNFLLLNSYICSKDKLRKDFVSGDLQSKFTRQIFDEHYEAFDLDKDLPHNISSMLSTRYAVRANTNVSDYYMYKCLSSKDFVNYLNGSNKEYLDSLNSQKNEL